MAQLVKTIGGLAIASVKTVGGLAIASVKTVAGLDNTAAAGNTATFDAHFEEATNASASPYDTGVSGSMTVPGTIGATSSTNLVATFYVMMLNLVTSGVAVIWDQGGTNQSATQIGTTQTVGALYNILIFQVVAPTTGSKVVRVSWTGGASQVVVGCVSTYNAAQSLSGTLYTNTGTGTSTTLTVTSADKHMAIFASVDDNASSATIANGTEDWQERRFNGNQMMGHRASTTTSTVGGWTLGTSVAWGMIGVDITNL